MASVNLKDFKKYFRFIWDNRYEFIGMPNSFRPYTHIFTKQMNPPFSFLQAQGYQSLI